MVKPQIFKIHGGHVSQFVRHIENVNLYFGKGDKGIFYRVAGRFVWVLVGVIFGYLACNAFAEDETRVLTLSGALAQAKLFKGLTDAERGALQTAATLRRGKVGECIIQQGKTMGRMFIIMDGQAEVRVNGRHIFTQKRFSII